MNRNGTTTTLTDGVYDLLFDSKNISPEERLVIYARHLAMLTEFWRAHRRVAGVLHFCGLGYSRPVAPRGQTSDNWIDLQNLTFQPAFIQYVKPAFAPVGLMLDTWEKTYQPDTDLNVPLYVINDLQQEFINTIKVQLLEAGSVISTQEIEVNVVPFGVKVEILKLNLPEKSGIYQLKASYTDATGEEIFSLRDMDLKF